MPKELDVVEMEYHELISTSQKTNSFKNHRFGLRIKTSPLTYEKDFADLVIAVKTKLNTIIISEKGDKKK